eukprot:TRINITY_DN863_c0_g1_i1.p1 TRINITY_DN863_c0_g1~~TRINITY_DN863_c0_g1_i1.p1  ORF type:complete len:136 (-),score=31.64 TRINITY_DN863_c0_g1_i1:779-1186(-)
MSGIFGVTDEEIAQREQERLASTMASRMNNQQQTTPTTHTTGGNWDFKFKFIDMPTPLTITFDDVVILQRDTGIVNEEVEVVLKSNIGVTGNLMMEMPNFEGGRPFSLNDGNHVVIAATDRGLAIQQASNRFPEV